MDILLSDRGQLVPVNGEFPVSNNNGTLKKMYLRAAILIALRDENLQLDRIHSSTQNLSSIELAIKNAFVNYLNSSPFASDFDTNRISISLTPPSTKGIAGIKVTYEPGEEDRIQDSLFDNFTIEGGDLLLGAPDMTFPAPAVDQLGLAIEEIAVREIAVKLLLSLPAQYPVCVLRPGERPKVIILKGSLSDIPEGQRKTFTPSGEGITSPIGQPDPTGSGIDSLVLSDFDIEDVFLGQTVIQVTDVKGNIRSITYDEEAEDFVIQIDQVDPEYEIEVIYADTIAKGAGTVLIEGTSLDDIAHPFPAAGKFGPNISLLDKPVDEGLYTVVYRTNGRSDYNASMWSEP